MSAKEKASIVSDAGLNPSLENITGHHPGIQPTDLQPTEPQGNSIMNYCSMNIEGDC